MESEFNVSEQQAAMVVGKFMKSNEKDILFDKNLEDLDDFAEEIAIMQSQLKS